MMSDTRAAWLEARRSGIGGSDAPAILGVSKWRTPLTVYREKRGELTPDDVGSVAAVEWGTRLEPVIRQAYADRTGETVRVPDALLRHPQHAYMIGNLDGVTDSGKVLEIKTARSMDGWGEPGTDQIPDAYLVQVQHYLAITAYPVADVAVLFGGSDLALYQVPADLALQATLVEAEGVFWQHVVEGLEPAPQTLEDARLKWGRTSTARKVVAPEPVTADVAQLRALRAELARLEALADEAQLRICAAMADADTLVDVDGRVLATWKAGKPSERLDLAALRAAHPELAASFTRAGDPTRKFLLKTGRS